jgi:hypothetical protein
MMSRGYSLSETRIISTSDVIVLSAFPNPLSSECTEGCAEHRIPLTDAFYFTPNRFLGMECASKGIVLLTPSSWELR